MMFTQVTTAAGCFVIQFGSGLDFVFGLGLIAIPAASIPLIARIARRSPSQALLRGGRRQAGVRLYRAGLLVVAVSVSGIVASIVLGRLDPSSCDASSGAVAVVSVLFTLVGGLLIGGGWALATHSTWVVLATIAVLDAWILYFNLIVGADDPEAVRGLLLLAFAIHGICTTVAARWSFAAQDLGPVERAKAGEAGRTLAAVWAFLASYTALTLVRSDSGIFDTAAGSAVTGALTLGALAVTMGSGFTKYAEAIHSKPSRAAAGQPVTVDPESVGLDVVVIETAEPTLPAPTDHTEPAAEPRGPSTG